MLRQDTDRMRRVLSIACLSALIATIGLGGGLLAQSPSPSSPPDAPGTPAPDAESHLFPSAEEISGILDVDIEARGIRDDLSQLWEGADFDWDAIASAQLQTYSLPESEAQDSIVGVSINVVHFEDSNVAAQAAEQLAPTISDGSSEFPTDLTADFVATGSFASDDGFGGSMVVVGDGLVVVVVTAAATGATEMEAVAETVVELVLDRLEGEIEP